MERNRVFFVSDTKYLGEKWCGGEKYLHKTYINTCGVESLEVTQINDLTAVSVQQVKQDLEELIKERNFKVA